MNTADQKNTKEDGDTLSNRLTLSIIGGSLLIGIALIGIIGLSFIPESPVTPETPPETGITPSREVFLTPTDEGVTGAQIARAAGALMTPPPTNTPLPTQTPAPTSTSIPTATATPEPTTEATSEPPAEIFWTQEEKNALGWLCYGEVGGMAGAKVDACLSVLSTVRARYAYSNGFSETDVMGTLLRPGQFNVTVHTDRPGPDPDLNWAVEQYMNGMRGSCNGYLYFDSVPGGPSLCQIFSNYGWIEFHNGWN